MRAISIIAAQNAAGTAANARYACSIASASTAIVDSAIAQIAAFPRASGTIFPMRAFTFSARRSSRRPSSSAK